MNITDKPHSFSEAIYSDLLISIDLISDLYEAKCSELTIEKESSEYGACKFKCNSMNITFRSAKTTPTKIGQFVTLWKRIGNGPIQPYEITDDIDFVVISTRHNNNYGQFIFPKSILSKHGIIANNKKGKLAFRIYPPWDITTSNQARKTQEWQLQYFLEFSKSKPINYSLAKTLYSAL